MPLLLSWLKEHLDTSASLDQIVEALTRVGLEVESVEDPAKVLAPYITAHVISAEQHPNADRLRVCMVDTGDGKPVQVVCGAPNARAGMKSVFSPPGTFIPGKNITITVGVVRGVESAGMLCSAFELGLSEDHEASSICLPMHLSACAMLIMPVLMIRSLMWRLHPTVLTRWVFMVLRAILLPQGLVH